MMKLFRCQGCQAALHFENSQCLTCHRAVGFLEDCFAMSALESGPQSFIALGGDGGNYRYCGNAQQGVCNWMVRADSPETFCESCRLNQIVPDLSIPSNRERWGKLELAKRYVIRSILRWGLTHPSKVQDPENGLAFEFLGDVETGAGPSEKVLSGHADGLITLNVAEADDGEREKRRNNMGEPYRTLIGHFRHEIGHYYWDRLVRDGGQIEAFRTVFGDESQDYGEALKRHYSQGAPGNWRDHFISSYATAHPWEDFAETWAHYLHIVDALETARSYGVNIRANFMPEATNSQIDFNPYMAPSAERLIDAWTPLTIALNGVNRSMGQPDLYPFVLNIDVMKKLEFIHTLVHVARNATIAATTAQAA
jgi:hypothetical protein